ncbi:Na+/H+ antiporter subunit E [Methanospirillum stamsii]|uniref:Cation:proton antiporter n=1 Tax=Methanospirillum stamsii TaxID=1277351 RepID=A0A2V2N9W2_9EURY|nr:Na+/H+ antiporter subunit E [Methanospirillum stamsii]PWR75375.1 cation:proton antiporter [Methanospirillum stamsii]
MIPFFVTAFVAFLFYLVLVVGSGSVLFWSTEEITAGVIIGLVTGILCRKIFCKSEDYRMLNPVRLIQIIFYLCGPFLVELTKANFDVAYRVITGRIRPGIIRLRSGMKSPLAMTMLAHSITLTPGTLSVDVDEKTHDLFIHVIHLDEGVEKKEALEAKEVFSYMDIPKWIRRIAE